MITGNSLRSLGRVASRFFNQAPARITVPAPAIPRLGPLAVRHYSKNPHDLDPEMVNYLYYQTMQQGLLNGLAKDYFKNWQGIANYAKGRNHPAAAATAQAIGQRCNERVELGDQLNLLGTNGPIDPADLSPSVLFGLDHARKKYCAAMTALQTGKVDYQFFDSYASVATYFEIIGEKNAHIKAIKSVPAAEIAIEPLLEPQFITKTSLPDQNGITEEVRSKNPAYEDVPPVHSDVPEVLPINKKWSNGNKDDRVKEVIAGAAVFGSASVIAGVLLQGAVDTKEILVEKYTKKDTQSAG